MLAQIESLRLGKPSRWLLTELARIANRNHASLHALRLLHPVIVEDRNNIAKASDDQLTVYAKSLLSVGALEEATECLGRLEIVTPESLLTKAFVHFAKWEYGKALPVLREYIRRPLQSEYLKLVGKINLLSASIVVGDLHEATVMSNELMEVLEQEPEHQLLYGNCLELRAQIHICTGSYEEALNLLNASAHLLQAQPGRYLLYVNKWRAIARLGISVADQEAHQLLNQVKLEARELKNWETLRDCDFHAARLSRNEIQLQRVLHGTPYKGFQDRTERIFGIKSVKTDTFTYCPMGPSEFPEQVGFDTETDLDYSFFTSTSWPLLKTMIHDTYRPPRMSAVFSALYKGQYFDPFTSPQRVRNTVFRFNQWTSEAKIPLAIKVQDGEFHFHCPQGFAIACRKSAKDRNREQLALQEFQTSNVSKSFTCAQLAQFIEVTPPTALKLIKKGIESKRIRKLHQGKNSRYIFSSGRKKL